MVWWVSKPYAIVGVLLPRMYPIVTIMATLPWKTLASCKRFTPPSSLSLLNPKGSKKPSGALLPGRLWQGRDASGTHPLSGLMAGTSDWGSTNSIVCLITVLGYSAAVLDIDTNIFKESGDVGAKAHAALRVAERITSFIVYFELFYPVNCNCEH